MNLFIQVKSLPISGTGTHKYDFPHVDMPSLPVHFCDCEEHNVSAPTGNAEATKLGDLDAENGGMGEDELNIMNAVMNKLFVRQAVANCNGTMAVKDKESSKTSSTDNQQFEESKVDSDEDNLVLNMMTSDSKSKILPLNSGSKSFEAHRNNKVRNHATLTTITISYLSGRCRRYSRCDICFEGLLKYFGFLHLIRILSS